MGGERPDCCPSGSGGKYTQPPAKQPDYGRAKPGRGRGGYSTSSRGPSARTKSGMS